MKKTFVMAAVIMLSVAATAQTKKPMKNQKMMKDSMQTIDKDSMYMSGDSTKNGKYQMKKDKMKMKSKSKMPVDSSSTMN